MKGKKLLNGAFGDGTGSLRLEMGGNKGEKLDVNMEGMCCDKIGGSEGDGSVVSGEGVCKIDVRELGGGRGRLRFDEEVEMVDGGMKQV
ncbi:hypothetical protein [Bacillus pumilus]|uniref:hypothetical protein n=1 Tax=Bacillus pumilus TaxID=1408 RepID=UPI0011A75DBF|nr:hypothetical protein [Bacillus pumilus]